MIAPLLIALVFSAASPDGGPSHAIQPIGFQSRATPDKVKLGEPFTYELVVTHEPNQRYELTRPKDLGDFEMFGVERNRVDAQGKTVTTFKVKLALYALGTKTIPDMPFDVIDAEGAHTWIAKGIEVEGLSSLPADADEKGADLMDIKPPTEVPVRSYRLLWALAGIAAAAALGYGIYRWVKARADRPVVMPPPKPLGERVRAQLDALRAEDLPAKGRSQELYFRLSEIVRGYLGARYEFEALECTSAELMDQLRRLHTPGLPIEDFSRFNDESDLVKFAKQDATPIQCKQALDFAYTLLDRTWPPPPPPVTATPTSHGPGRLVQ